MIFIVCIVTLLKQSVDSVSRNTRGAKTLFGVGMIREIHTKTFTCQFLIECKCTKGDVGYAAPSSSFIIEVVEMVVGGFKGLCKTYQPVIAFSKTINLHLHVK